MFDDATFIKNCLIPGTEEESICLKANPDYANMSEDEKKDYAEYLAMKEIERRA